MQEYSTKHAASTLSFEAMRNRFAVAAKVFREPIAVSPILLLQSDPQAPKLTYPCLPCCAQRFYPASSMDPFDSFSNRSASVAIFPWRFTHRVCKVAICSPRVPGWAWSMVWHSGS